MHSLTMITRTQVLISSAPPHSGMIPGHPSTCCIAAGVRLRLIKDASRFVYTQLCPSLLPQSAPLSKPPLPPSLTDDVHEHDGDILVRVGQVVHRDRGPARLLLSGSQHVLQDVTREHLRNSQGGPWGEQSRSGKAASGPAPSRDSPLVPSHPMSDNTPSHSCLTILSIYSSSNHIRGTVASPAGTTISALALALFTCSSMPICASFMSVMRTSWSTRAETFVWTSSSIWYRVGTTMEYRV